VIAVLTAPRPGGVDYLTATLDMVDESATSARFLIVDGGAAETRADWSLVMPRYRPDVGRPANRFAAWEAIQIAHHIQEDLILLEDDIELVSGAMAWAERLAVPDDSAFVSLYTPRMAGVRGLWRSTAHHYCYAQALKFPLRTIDAMIAAPHEWIGSWFDHTDSTLRAIGIARRWRYALHLPSLAQHVGAVSVLCLQGLDADRVAPSYPGRSFDATSLRVEDYL